MFLIIPKLLHCKAIDELTPTSAASGASERTDIPECECECSPVQNFDNTWC